MHGSCGQSLPISLSRPPRGGRLRASFLYRAGLSIGSAGGLHLAVNGCGRLPIAGGAWRTHQTSRPFEVSGDLGNADPRGLSGFLEVTHRKVALVAVVVIDSATST